MKFWTSYLWREVSFPMLNKLAFRNVKRSVRDYMVYFLTMAVVTALMFSFNTLLFSEDVQKMFDMFGSMAIMTGFATFFIVLIIAWLINYMVRFILEKRSREFGIYLLIGMKKKEASSCFYSVFYNFRSISVLL